MELADDWLRARLRDVKEHLLWQNVNLGYNMLPEEKAEHGPFGQIGPQSLKGLKDGASAAGRAAASPFGALITVTIGDRAVRVLVARGHRVRKWAEAVLPPGVVQDGLIVDEQTFLDALNAVISSVRKDSRLKGTRVSVAITGRNIVQRRFTVFLEEGENLSEAIIQASAERMSIRPEELQLDWDAAPADYQDDEQLEDEEEEFDALEELESELEPEPEGDPHDVYAFGMYRHVLRRNLRSVVASGAKLAGVQPKVIALAAAANERSGVILDVEANSVTAIVLRDGLPEVVREVGVDSRLGREQWVQTISTQISRTVAFHDSMYPDSPLSPDAPLFVTGTNASDAGTAESGVSAVTFPRKQLPRTLRAPEEFPYERFAANVGLALVTGNRWWERSRVTLVERARLDFRPPEYKPRPFPVRATLTAAAVAVLAVGFGAFTSATVAQMSSVDTARETLTGLERQVALREAEIQRIMETRATIEAIRQQTEIVLANAAAIKDRDRGFSGTISILDALMPEGATLQEIDDDGSLIGVTVGADDYEILLGYVRALESEPSFDQVSVRSLGAVDENIPNPERLVGVVFDPYDPLAGLFGSPEDEGDIPEEEVVEHTLKLVLELTRAEEPEEPEIPDEEAAQVAAFE